MKNRILRAAHRPICCAAIYFLIGAFGYGSIELLWRGRTHLSMLLLGGICLLILRAISHTRLPFFSRCAAGALAITVMEFAMGCVVNRWLGLAVWDYSANRMNLMGQICPLYTALWFLLCAGIDGVRQARDLLVRAIAGQQADGKSIDFIPEEGTS